MEPVSPKTRSKKFQQEKGGHVKGEGETVHFEENETSHGQAGPQGNGKARDTTEHSPKQENGTTGYDAGESGSSNGNKDDDAEGEEEGDEYAPLPLSGFRVYIIHVKDALSDEAGLRKKILEELREHGEQAGLGCEFYAPECGEWAFV